MNKSNKKYKFLIIIFTLIIIGLIFASSLIGNKSLSNIKSLIPVDQRELIKKYISIQVYLSTRQNA